VAPAFWFGGCPGLQVQVEGADGEEWAVQVQAGLAVTANEKALLPLLHGSVVQARVGLVGVDVLDDFPEVLDKVAHQVVQGGVVQLDRAATQVVDQQVADCGVAQPVSVDQGLDGVAGLGLWRPARCGVPSLGIGPCRAARAKPSRSP
jgi:hypothetical protein